MASWSSSRSKAVLGLIVVLATVAALQGMGRLWWCACRSPVPWTSDVISSHNSQHLLDPYSFSHFQHGLVFYLLLWALLRHRLDVMSRGLLMLGLEASWEIFENTPFTIERYRAATISLDYYGDSILNSIGDLASCTAGYLFAAAVPTWASIIAYLAVELGMILLIRDSLLLNVLMLVHPVDAVRRWQQGG